MNIVSQLFSDWVGILSAFTVGFILAMAVFFIVYVRRHMREEEREHRHSPLGH